MTDAEKLAFAKTRLFKIRFIHRVKKGLSAREIAEQLGVSVYSVRDRAKRYGLTVVKKQRGPRARSHYVDNALSSDLLRQIDEDLDVDRLEAQEA